MVFNEIVTVDDICVNLNFLKKKYIIENLKWSSTFSEFFVRWY